MACGSYTLNGLNNNCKEASFGGVKEVYIAIYDDVESVSVSDNVIDSITMKADKKFMAYRLLKSTSGLTSTLNTSETTSSYFTNEVTLQFIKMETKKRLEILSLMMAPTAVIILDANGKYWYLGKDNYVEASAGSATTGTATSDSNHYELTLSDTSAELPFEVKEEAVKAVIQYAVD